MDGLKARSARRAVAIFRTLGQPNELARSLRLLGSALASTSEAAAREAWTEALHLAQRLGAAPEQRTGRRLPRR